MIPMPWWKEVAYLVAMVVLGTLTFIGAMALLRY